MPLTVEQFTQRLTSSGVMSEDDLRGWIASVPVEQRPPDGELMARELVKQKRLTKFQAEQIYAGKEKSLTLGNYLLLDKLGQGGMGMVLKATHKRMGRVVALKVMSPAAVKSPDAVKRFHREVQTAAKLTHPNIVTAFDADEAKGTHFLVMEYVEGDDLSQLVKKHGAMSVEQAIECIIQAARGLTHAHAEGVIHRDIKPANLLLDKHGTVKILDMGLARLETGLSDAAGVAGAGLTQSGTIMGTVDYMSPEQAEDTRHADARADIYSLGCSLYYLLSGHAVYGGETMMKKLLAHRDAPIPSLVAALRSRIRESSEGRDEHGSLTTSATNALDAVFHKMIAKRPADRYQSMPEVIADLERCRAGQSVTMNVAAVSGESGSSFELQNFLRQISGETGGSGTSAGTIGTSTTPVDVAAETMLLTNNGSGTDPQTEMTLASERPVAGLVRVRSLGGLLRILTNSATKVGMLVAAVVLLLVGVWLFRTPRGVMQVEITDAEIEVAIGETNQTLKGEQNKTLKLPIGEHVLHVTLGKTQLDTPEITVAKGEPVEIKVERVGNRVRVMRGKEFLVAKELPKTKTNGSKSGNAVVTAEAGSQFALEFDGKASYVEIPDVGLTLSKPLTVETWVRLDKSKSAADGGVFLFGSSLSLDVNETGRFSFYGANQSGAGPQIFSNNMAELNEWVHVAGVSDGTTRSLFVNGVRQKASTRNRPQRDMTTGIILGALPLGGKKGNGKFLAGQLRETRVSSVARYQTDFQPDQRFTPDKDTLALYHFDDGQGNVLKDSSGSNHHGLIVGAKWVRVGEAPAVTVAGQGGLLFDFNSAITVPSLKMGRADPLCIEGYVQPLKIMEKPYTSIMIGFPGELILAHNNPSNVRLNATLYTDKSDFAAFTENPIELGRRVHLAAVRQGGRLRIFMNGKLMGSTLFPPESQANRNAVLTMGNGFQGVISEVRISKTHRYDKPFTPAARFASDQDTVALYHFDEGSGDVLKDSSGNNHHGKIVGAKWVKGSSASNDALKSQQEPSWELSGRVFLRPLNLDFTKPVTIEAFATPSEATGSHHLFVAGPPEFSLRFVKSSEWEFFGLSAFKLKSQPQSFPRRMHVAAVLDNGQARLYVDGRKEQDAKLDASKLAGLEQTNTQLGQNFVGTFHEVRISQVARYDRDFTPQKRFTPDANTVALYHCDEGSGDVLNDSSGNNHHGQITGARWVKVGAVQPSPFDRLRREEIPPAVVKQVFGDKPPPAELVALLPIPGENNQPSTFTHLGIAPDGSKFLVSGHAPAVHVFDAATARSVATVSASHILNSRFLADGRSLALVNSGGGLHLAELPAATQQIKNSRDGGPPSDISEFTSDGRQVFIGFRDGLVRHVETATGRLIGEFQSSTERLRGLRLSPNDQQLYLLRDKEPRSGTILVTRSLASGKELTFDLGALLGRDYSNFWVHPSGTSLWLADTYKTSLKRFVFGSPTLLPDVDIGEVWRGFAIRGDGGQFATIGQSGKLKVWDNVTLQVTREISLPVSEPWGWSLAYAPDGRHLVVLQKEPGVVLVLRLESAEAGSTKQKFASDEWIDVLPLIDPALDKSEVVNSTGKNDWRVERGELKYVGDGKSGKLFFPVRYQGRSLEWEIDFTRTEGTSALSLDIPLPGGVVPITVSNDKITLKYEALNNQFRLVNGQRVKLRARVLHDGASDRVELFVNDAPAGHWTGSLDKQKWAASGSELRNPAEHNGIFIVDQGDFTFHAIRVRMLNGGTAELLRPAADSATTFTNSLGMEFVRVPKGKSWLGGGGGKLGTQEVTISEDFYLGKFEVTQDEWLKVTGTNLSHFSRGGAGKEDVKAISDVDLKRFPVEGVSWDDCQEFLAKLNAATKEAGWEYRLPTEVQWEYAARGGPLSDPAASGFNFYFEQPANQMLTSQSNFEFTNLRRTCPVGQYPPNPLGLHDLFGNVREWCSDEEQHPGDKTWRRAVRGGAWAHQPEFCRAARHDSGLPVSRINHLGLRVARVRAETQAAWQPLFNGKDLTGWAKENSGKAEVAMEDGQPILRLTEPVTLSRPVVGDYHLRFECKLFASEYGGGLHLIAEPNILFSLGLGGDFRAPAVSSRGCIYQSAKIQAGQFVSVGQSFGDGAPFRLTNVSLDATNPWQRIEVVRLGDSFVIRINGKITGAVTNLRVLRDGKQELPKPTAPLIFWAFGGPAQFRNIEIREINALPPEIAP